MQRLLADIEARRIRVVMVYKVDRLTRSLADFAKIVERFDALGVSFVSVTQQFNTTSSMGRLTLNVLLSFAQFEREVTGERIRDKIAASKQKGLWMGGSPPLGYRGKDRTLEIDVGAAPLVRHVFARYLVLGCVRQLKGELDAAGVVTPVRMSQSGRRLGGKAFSRGHLYKLLANPVYVGQIAHRDKVYPGQHPPLLERSVWEAAQAQLAANRQGYTTRRAVPSASLLAGLVVDAEGKRLIPSHSQKQTRRYRYYVSEPLVKGVREATLEGMRIPATELEARVTEVLLDWLDDEHALLEALAPPAAAVQRILERAGQLRRIVRAEGTERHDGVRRLIASVIVATDSIEVVIDPAGLDSHAGRRDSNERPLVRRSVSVRIKRCGFAMRLLVAGQSAPARQQDTRLITHLSRAHDWLLLLMTGKARSVREIALRENLSPSHITRMLYRACLAPDIVLAILDGTHPPEFTSETLKRNLPLPIDWREQRRLLGFPSI